MSITGDRFKIHTDGTIAMNECPTDMAIMDMHMLKHILYGGIWLFQMIIQRVSTVEAAQVKIANTSGLRTSIIFA